MGQDTVFSLVYFLSISPPNTELSLEEDRSRKKKFSVMRPCTHLSHIMSQLVYNSSMEISLKQSA
ncbi:hypothetical protein ACSS6W_001663 [Trichoderma asperelloides]